VNPPKLYALEVPQGIKPSKQRLRTLVCYGKKGLIKRVFERGKRKQRQQEEV
jgi:hypothetical protein